MGHPLKSSLAGSAALAHGPPNRVVRAFKRAGSWIERQLPSMDPKDLLPIGIEATRGVVTLGNASTPELIVADFRRADGTYGIVPVRCPLFRHFAHCVLNRMVRLAQGMTCTRRFLASSSRWRRCGMCGTRSIRIRRLPREEWWTSISKVHGLSFPLSVRRLLTRSINK
jgi:hypothetical protein